jgi:hypothetical protein
MGTCSCQRGPDSRSNDPEMTQFPLLQILALTLIQLRVRRLIQELRQSALCRSAARCPKSGVRRGTKWTLNGLHAVEVPWSAPPGRGTLAGCERADQRDSVMAVGNPKRSGSDSSGLTTRPWELNVDRSWRVESFARPQTALRRWPVGGYYQRTDQNFGVRLYSDAQKIARPSENGAFL